jgi:hypothetical protein
VDHCISHNSEYVLLHRLRTVNVSVLFWSEFLIEGFLVSKVLIEFVFAEASLVPSPITFL